MSSKVNGSRPLFASLRSREIRSMCRNMCDAGVMPKNSPLCFDVQGSGNVDGRPHLRHPPHQSWCLLPHPSCDAAQLYEMLSAAWQGAIGRPAL